jgi:hypothetical protein
MQGRKNEIEWLQFGLFLNSVQTKNLKDGGKCQQLELALSQWFQGIKPAKQD